MNAGRNTHAVLRHNANTTGTRNQRRRTEATHLVETQRTRTHTATHAGTQHWTHRFRRNRRNWHRRGTQHTRTQNSGTLGTGRTLSEPLLHTLEQVGASGSLEFGEHTLQRALHRTLPTQRNRTRKVRRCLGEGAVWGDDTGIRGWNATHLDRTQLNATQHLTQHLTQLALWSFHPLLLAPNRTRQTGAKNGTRGYANLGGTRDLKHSRLPQTGLPQESSARSLCVPRTGVN